MNSKTIIFLVTLGLIIGLVTGYSIHKPPIIQTQTVSTITVRDTIIRDTIIRDTIKIPAKKVKYFDSIVAKNDVVINEVIDSINSIIDSLKCLSFPLLLSDSSKIEVTECSKENIPKDLTFSAQYIDKREKVRIVESLRVDTVRQSTKRIGFSIGPSAGVGIDINNLRQPAYFVGVTLTWGIRF